jgi:superfamily II DNA/RNA helicase
VKNLADKNLQIPYSTNPRKLQMEYAVRLDNSINTEKKRNAIAGRVAPHLGLSIAALERQLERPDKSIMVRSNKRTAAEFIARWLRAYGVRVTVIEFKTSTTLIKITRHASLTIPPKANGFIRVPLGRQPVPTIC